MEVQPLPTLADKATQPMSDRPKRRGRQCAILTADEKHEREERRLAKRRGRYGSSTYVCECGETVKKDNKQHTMSQKHIRVIEQKRLAERVVQAVA